jgi:hypothetical protein
MNRSGITHLTASIIQGSNKNREKLLNCCCVGVVAFCGTGILPVKSGVGEAIAG